MVKEYKCSLCGKCHLKDRRPIKSTSLKKYVSSIIGRNIENDEIICGKCRAMFNKSAKTNVQTNNNPSEDSDSDFVVENPPIIDIGSSKAIHLKISSTHTSHKYCIVCPYLSNGKNNDAAITKHMVTVNAEGMNEWLQQDDVCIVDRGFRDVVEYLEEQGFSVQMPLYLKKGQKQHTTEEANTSRLVTKVRWIVESVNDGEISEWYCTCKVGARIVGCCAHVSSVLWYLELYRLQNTSITSPRFTKSVLDASDLPDLETDSDCSSDVEE
ncbi:unnamed protein product [Mytilus coruscus]|uniref:SWIM-type domain-containing protein n=1 Tax=Mytilus coruscus TaxID=42192 RepID=A0A6J8D4L3_MYTCO|nr:unnamed protein product [Mytilus coruscus]